MPRFKREAFKSSGVRDGVSAIIRRRVSDEAVRAAQRERTYRQWEGEVRTATENARRRMAEFVRAMGDKCSICLEGYDRANRPVLASCGHALHSDCLAEWKQSAGRNATCPTCKQRL